MKSSISHPSAPTLAAALALAVLARAQEVKVEHDPAADFGRIKTFAVKIGTSWGNEASEASVRAEFEEALAARGWTVTDPEKADAHVVLHGATEKKKTTESFYTGMAIGGGGWYTTEREYTAGTLVADILDARTGSVLWHGVAEDELSEKQEKNRKKLEKVTKKLFQDFPPRKAGEGKDAR